MSSAATITFDPDTVGVPPDAWRSFCVDHAIVHSPQTVGGNVYYWGGHGGVEVHYDTHSLRFSTFWHGTHRPDVARLALFAWRLWGGSLEADPEVRQFIGQVRG